MKRIIALLLALGCVLFSLAGCGQEAVAQTVVPLDDLPEDYSLENAKSDHCVVYADSDITYGQAEWEAFVKATRAGKTAAVRLAFYYMLQDESRYSAELYEEIKNDYPVLYIKDLTFDGEKYTVESIDDDDAIISKEYAYLMKYVGKPRSQSALFSDYVYYVLVNDNTVTWEEIEDGMYSSQLGAYIDHSTVYSDWTFKKEKIQKQKVFGGI